MILIFLIIPLFIGCDKNYIAPYEEPEIYGAWEYYIPARTLDEPGISHYIRIVIVFNEYGTCSLTTYECAANNSDNCVIREEQGLMSFSEKFISQPSNETISGTWFFQFDLLYIKNMFAFNDNAYPFSYELNSTTLILSYSSYPENSPLFGSSFDLEYSRVILN